MKKTLKTLLAIVAVMATLLMFAGCASDTDGTDQSGTTTTTAGKTDGIDKSQIKVGVIHIGDPKDGAGYSYAHDQGIVAMQQELGLTDDQIVRQNNVDDRDNAAIKNAIEDCIAKGCNIIFGTSYGYMDTMEEMSKEYPDVYFSHGSGYKSNDTNFNNYFGRIYQARYLAGIAAGLKTETNKLGYVSAYGTDLAETCSGINAFALGAQSVNPDVKVYVKVMNSWYNPVQETELANALIEMGCDVIAQHCDTANPQIAANSAGVFGCGYNSDMTEQAPDAHLTAPVWKWGVYYTKAVQALIDGTWNELGNYYGGIKEGMVDVSELSKNCAPNTEEYIDQVKNLIKEDQWDVFSGKALVFEDDQVKVVDKALVDSQGNEIVAAGGPSVEDKVITGEMNYYVAGVEEK